MMEPKVSRTTEIARKNKDNNNNDDDNNTESTMMDESLEQNKTKRQATATTVKGGQ